MSKNTTKRSSLSSDTRNRDFEYWGGSNVPRRALYNIKEEEVKNMALMCYYPNGNGNGYGNGPFDDGIKPQGDPPGPINPY